MISFALEEDQQLVQAQTRKFATEVVRRDLRAWERAGAVPATAQAAFDALGLCTLDGPEGETGTHLTTLALVHEELSFGDAGAAVALWAPHVAAHALCELGDREQKERFLPYLLQGTPDPDGPAGQSDRAGRPRRGAVAYAEPLAPGPPATAGPAAGFSTRAVPVPARGGYLLSGHKSFVVNAGLVDLVVVLAQLDPAAGWDGWAAFVVTGRPGQRQGLRAGARHGLLGLETVPCGELHFADCFVPERDRLLGGPAPAAALSRFFARAQLVGAARQVGLARAAYELALSYTQDRRAFGKPVAHFQAISFTLADMLMDVEAARWLLWRAAAAADRGQPDPGLCAQAAAHANEAAWRVADHAVQLLGGAGYLQDFPAEKWLRDTRALSLLSGTGPLHDEVVAAAELGHKGPVLPAAALCPILS